MPHERQDWSAIRAAWESREEDGISIGQIARAFNVDKTSILRRARRDGWAHPAPKQRYQPVDVCVPADTVMRRCECGALYRAVLTREGASAHCGAATSDALGKEKSA